MCLVPLAERSGVDLHNGGFSEGVGADEFVVRRVERHGYDTNFAGYAFRAPGEVAGFETQGTVFGVPSSSTDEMDAFGADSGVGCLAAFLECSVDIRSGQRSAAGHSTTSSCGSGHVLRR